MRAKTRTLDKRFRPEGPLYDQVRKIMQLTLLMLRFGGGAIQYPMEIEFGPGDLKLTIKGNNTLVIKGDGRRVIGIWVSSNRPQCAVRLEFTELP